MWYQIKDDYVCITIAAKPNAKKSECLGVSGDVLKIALHAQPVEGKANIELIKFLAEFFKVRKSDVEIVRGENSKLKVVKLRLNENMKSFIKDKE